MVEMMFVLIPTTDGLVYFFLVEGSSNTARRNIITPFTKLDCVENFVYNMLFQSVDNLPVRPYWHYHISM